MVRYGKIVSARSSTVRSCRIAIAAVWMLSAPSGARICALSNRPLLASAMKLYEPRVSGVACARGTSSSRHAPRFAPRFDSFAITCGQAELHQAGDGLVERIGILISTGKHHAALERCNDLKGPRFRIRSADPLG